MRQVMQGRVAINHLVSKRRPDRDPGRQTTPTATPSRHAMLTAVADHPTTATTKERIPLIYFRFNVTRRTSITASFALRIGLIDRV